MISDQSSTASIDVIDAHVNLASTRFTPPQFIEDMAANVFSRFEQMGEKVPRKRVYDRINALYTDHDADGLVREMDEAGISSAVILTPDFSQVTQCELDPDQVAHATWEITQRHPGRFYVFAGVDPRHGNEGIDRFERCIREYGMSGMKLYPPCGYSPSDKRLFPYYELCAQHRLPVSVHTGPGWQAMDFQFGHPLLIDEAARAFPQVNFILGHGAVTHVEECSYLCVYRSNIFMDASGGVGLPSANGWPAQLNRVFRIGINHKIVFGSSWPVFKLSTTLERVVAEFRQGGAAIEGIKRREVKLIVSGNIRRLLSTPVSERKESAA